MSLRTRLKYRANVRRDGQVLHAALPCTAQPKVVSVETDDGQIKPVTVWELHVPSVSDIRTNDSVESVTWGTITIVEKLLKVTTVLPGHSTQRVTLMEA